MSVCLTTKEALPLPLHSDMDDEIQRRRRSNTGHGGSEYQQYRYQDEDDDDEYQVQGQFEFNISRSSICEIEEEEDDRDEGSNYSIGGSNSIIPVEIRELFGGKRYFPMPSIKEEQYDHINGRVLPDSSSSYNSNGDNIIDCVYVAIGKSESSMDALNYAVKQLLNTNTILYLIHIFPEIKYIPSPCKLINIFSIDYLFGVMYVNRVITILRPSAGLISLKTSIDLYLLIIIATYLISLIFHSSNAIFFIEIVIDISLFMP